MALSDFSAADQQIIRTVIGAEGAAPSNEELVQFQAYVAANSINALSNLLIAEDAALLTTEALADQIVANFGVPADVLDQATAYVLGRLNKEGADVGAIIAQIATVLGDPELSGNLNPIYLPLATSFQATLLTGLETSAEVLVPFSLTTGLADVAAAEAAETAKEEELADFLESAFSNEDVAGFVLDGADAGTDISSADVIEADIDQAVQDTATAVVASGEDEATFNGLTAAQQDARIAAAVVDLEADIASDQADVDAAAEDLATGVAAKQTIATAAGVTLTAALDAAAAAEAAADNSALAAGVVTSSTEADFVDVTFTYADGVINAALDATADSNADITSIVNGVVTLTAAVTLDADTGVYTIDDGTGTSTLTQSYLDALVVAVQAEYDAADDTSTTVSDAETALAAAINAVYNAQDTDGYDDDADAATANIDYAVTYAEMTADGTGDIISIDGNNVVTLDYDGITNVANLDTALTAVSIDALNVSDAALAALVGSEKALSDYQEAVATWEATDALVDSLADINTELGTLGTAVTDAEALVEAFAPTYTIDNAADDLASVNGTNDIHMANELTTAIGDQDLATFGNAGDADVIYFGEAVLNTGAIATDGDNAVLEFFMTDDGTDTTIVLETSVVGSNSSNLVDTVEIEVTGVLVSELSVDGGFVTLA